MRIYLLHRPPIRAFKSNEVPNNAMFVDPLVSMLPLNEKSSFKRSSLMHRLGLIALKILFHQAYLLYLCMVYSIFGCLPTRNLAIKSEKKWVKQVASSNNKCIFFNRTTFLQLLLLQISLTRFGLQTLLLPLESARTVKKSGEIAIGCEM